MKVAIMTWFAYHNYGTALQVTALTDTLKSLGHEVKASKEVVRVCSEVLRTG